MTEDEVDELTTDGKSEASEATATTTTQASETGVHS